MKKKILIALMALLLPAFLIVNSLADESKDDNEEITINNDIMVDSPLFTSKETYAKYEQPASSLIMDNFKLVISNSNFDWQLLKSKNRVDTMQWTQLMLDIFADTSSGTRRMP